MRIAFVSSYPPIECGIGTYTKYLSDALREDHNEVLILSAFGAQGRKVFPIFHSKDDNIASRVYDVSAQLTPDLIHIQHEFGLYGTQRGVQVIELILRFKLAGVPVAVTFHTVYPEMSHEESIITQRIIEDSSAIIVHEDYQKEILVKNFGSSDKIHVIPHGVRETEPIHNAKKKLELKGKKVILLCGYFRPTKCFHKVVEWFPKIAEKNKDAVLLIAGKSRGLEFQDYQKSFFEAINQSSCTDRIVVLRGQFPQNTFDTIISASDVMALPYEKSGQSGIMAQSYAFGKPIVTSDLIAFRTSIEKSKGGFVCKTETDFVNNLLNIVSNNELQRELTKNIATYVSEDVGWSRVAKAHVEMYHQIVRVPYGKAKYIYFE